MGPDYVPLDGRSGWNPFGVQSRHEVQDQLATRDEPDLLEPVFGLPVRTDDGPEERWGGGGHLRCSCGESPLYAPRSLFLFGRAEPVWLRSFPDWLPFVD